MKILLIGGSGIISTDITNLALQRGEDITILNRGRHSLRFPDGCKIIIGDANDPAVGEQLAGQHFDVIADFVAFSANQLAAHIKTFYPFCDQFIFISSATVYSRADQITPIREDTTPANNVDWEYCRGKIGGEKYLEMRRALDPSFCYTVVRPYVTYGDTRIPFPLIPSKHWTLVDRVKSGKPLLLPDTHNTCTLTHTVDFAKAFLGLCKNEKAYGEAFHITSGKTYPWSRVGEIIGDFVGKKAEFAYCPIVDIAREMYPAYGDVYSILKADKATSWVFDNSKILDAVPDFTCDYSLEDGIRRTLDAFVARGSTGIDEAWSATCDRIIAKSAK